MHNSTYNHAESEPHYKQYVSNIAYRYHFEVHEENDVIWKTENGVSTILADGDKVARNKIWYTAWMKLREEYTYSGI